jgi:putative Holliday junction resolvase
MRYLGLDIGDRWIGIALSDPSAKLASPFNILKRSDDITDIEAIASIIKQHDVGLVVVGLPRMLDGSIGIQAQKVQAFTQQLKQATEMEIEFRDEWLTTVAAKHIMHVNGTASKKKRRKDGIKKTDRQRDDAVAAAVILQAFLDEGQSQPI